MQALREGALTDRHGESAGQSGPDRASGSLSGGDSPDVRAGVATVPLRECVYLIAGWFGDIEWIEAIYASENAAEARAEELWKTRRSDVVVADHFVQGLCKFGVETHKVLA